WPAPTSTRVSWTPCSSTSRPPTPPPCAPEARTGGTGEPPDRPHLRGAHAGAAGRLARPDDRLDGAAHDRRRPGRLVEAGVGGHRLHAGLDGHHPAGG